MASGTGGMHKSGKLAGRKEMRGTSLIELRRGRRRRKRTRQKWGELETMNVLWSIYATRNDMDDVDEKKLYKQPGQAKPRN